MIKIRLNCLIIILLSCGAGLTYADKSLWGEVDQPLSKQPPKQAINPEDYGLPPPAPAAQQNTTCDVLTKQLDVSNDAATAIMNSQVSDEYKSIVAKPDQVNVLYRQFRAEYLKKYCSNSGSK